MTIPMGTSSQRLGLEATVAANSWPGGHEAHIDPAQEQDQPYIGVDKAQTDPEQLVPLEPAGDDLKH